MFIYVCFVFLCESSFSILGPCPGKIFHRVGWGAMGGIKNPQKRTRLRANSSRNQLASRTKRMQGRNIPFRATPHFNSGFAAAMRSLHFTAL